MFSVVDDAATRTPPWKRASRPSPASSVTSRAHGLQGHAEAVRQGVDGGDALLPDGLDERELAWVQVHERIINEQKRKLKNLLARERQGRPRRTRVGPGCWYVAAWPESGCRRHGTALPRRARAGGGPAATVTDRLNLTRPATNAAVAGA